jgi:hypothetical protein
MDTAPTLVRQPAGRNSSLDPQSPRLGFDPFEAVRYMVLQGYNQLTILALARPDRRGRPVF